MAQPQTVNCLVVVDAQALMNQYAGRPSSPASPIGLTPDDLKKRVYMVAGYESVIEGQATSNLNIRVQNGDSIRWSATSLTSDLVAFADLCMFNLRSSNPPNLVSPPVQISSDVWATFVISPNGGTVSYDWIFAVGWVGSGSSHPPMFYFKWDPTITVIPR
jgi:hypothetical protein